jgi:hypothetical protein
MRRFVFTFTSILFIGIAASSQQVAKGSLQGKVLDQQGALLPGVEIILIDAEHKERKVQTNGQGAFTFNGLLPGKYTLRAASNGFSVYENTEINVAEGKAASLDVTLNVTITENVNVSDDRPVSTDADGNASAIVLKETEIAALPDDPVELQAALQALAGPGAGPSGGEIFVDGFSGAKLPPRDSIKEVRVNQNPFSSEFDRMGLGRIEIITKPGTEKWNGEIQTQFEDESLNSRNPYARNRPPYQLRTFEGNLSGPLVKNKASFFMDAEHQAIDNNALINARILDPSLNIALLQQGIVTPSVGIEFNPRVDWQLNKNHSLTVRFGYGRDTQKNAGLGGFDLISRAYDNVSTDHSIRFTEAAILAPTVVNELRFQFVSATNTQNGGSNLPTIQVNDAFTSGGANIGNASSKDTRLEINNGTTFLRGNHILKFGGRFRRVEVTNIAPTNFAGTFTFTSIDQYKNTILNQSGAFPTQFAIAGGDPNVSIGVIDYGAYLQDEWKLRPNLSLSLGLRYENQNGVSDNLNWAPRFGFAYAPGAGKGQTAKTVIRGGFGVFYERFGRNLILQAKRLDGIRQQQFVVTDPTILDSIIFTSSGVSNIPTIHSLAAFAQPQTTRVIATDLRIPTHFQTAISIERQLPFKTTISLSYINTSIRRQLRSRNINAPLNGIRPLPTAGNIFSYESTGRYDQNQLIVNFKSNFSSHASFFGNYSFGGAKSDTDGAGNFPASSYDLSNEYGDSAQDIRHRFTLGGSYTAPFGFRLSPFLSYRSGIPFNITTGLDSNGDTLFTDRPALATDLNRQCNFGTAANPSIRSCVVRSRFGDFDLKPIAGQTIIPRNFGRGTNYLGVNLTVAKEFGIGPKNDGDDESPYKLDFSVQARNIFNHTNQGSPVGNLSSLFFGQATSSAGAFGGNGGSSTASNRRIKLSVTFSF